MAQTTATTEKKHAACDECRTRKLKCSGEQPQCSRCEREKIECIYSPQKQMGRPRKRRRDDEPPAQRQRHSPPVMNLREFGSNPLVYVAPGMDSTNFAMDLPVDSVELHPSPHLPYPNGHGDYDSFSLPESMNNIFPIDPALGSLLSPTPYTTGSSGPSNSVSPPDSGPMDHTISPLSNVSCACLSSMYLTLSNLQALSNYSFPFALRPLRQAMGTAETVLECQQCPKDPTSGMLNVSIVTSLLFAIAERFRKIVEEINAEAARVRQCGEVKRFHLGDANGDNMHLHTQTPDCPARFDLDLDASEWQMMSKKVVKKEVLGSDEHWTGLLGMISRLQQRQLQWHTDPEMEKMRERMFGLEMCQAANKNRDWNCVRQAAGIRNVVDNIPW